MKKPVILLIATLAIANIALYATPFTACTEVNNLGLDAISAVKAFGPWRLVKDIGATEIEVTGLPGSNILRKEYANDAGQAVQMVIVANNFRTSIHAPTDCLPAQGWVIESMKTVRERSDGDTLSINSILAHYDTGKGKARDMVWYWYAVHNGNYGNHFFAVVHNSIQRVFFGRKYYWALIRLSTHVTGSNEAKAFEALQSFLQNTYPAIKQSKDSSK